VPGERGPSMVPMMPLADFVALSASVSNHSSRKSAELMVSSLCSMGKRPGPSERKCRASAAMPDRFFSENELGSGGAMPSSGFMARAIWCSIRPNSS
jgi:hypothetical protein